MAFSVAGIDFANNAGLWGLLSLIPFIIIYLIRPRPKKVEIPSLMFFLTNRDNPKQQSFLRNFAKDWLFILQLLILLLFVSQLIEPITTYEHDITSENTVIVFDVSASMQTRRSDGDTRFAFAKSLAAENLGKSNTIILAGGTPKVVLTDGTYDDAVEILNGLTPSDSPSAIGESLVLAGELLGSREGRVIALSDFINTRGVETDTAKTALESKGAVVDFIDVTSRMKRSNVGIIDLEVDDATVTVFVRNFDTEKKSATLQVGDITKKLDMEPQSTETVSFGTPERSMTIQLIVDDDFDADNIAYLSVPKKEETNILLITNNDSIFLSNAMTSGQKINVKRTEPPIVPTGGYDIYVLADIDPDQVLPGTYQEIEKEVKAGASVVIAGQDDLASLDYGDILPVNVIGLRSGVVNVQVDQDTRFTQNTDFGSVDRVIEASPKSGAISLASAGPNSTVLTFQELGEGKTIYYGLIEGASHFKLSPAYPIFWNNLIHFLTDQQNIQSLNTRTGETRVLEEVRSIKTPKKTVRQNVISFDDAGYYEYDETIIAANLLDQQESTINAQKEINVTFARDVVLKPVTEERELSFVIPLIIAVMILIFLELLYVKVRGDL